MKRFISRMRQSVVLAAVLVFMQACPPVLWADGPVKLKQFAGTIDLSARGPVPFTLVSSASHLDKFTSYGEVQFVPGAQPGTLIGKGVVVLRVANGDQLVGVVSCDVGRVVGDQRPTNMLFSWRDSVRFSDGTVVTNTGQFEDEQPQNLVVIAIIAILIGLLLPAVQ
jgi:hypothetical protein